MKNSMSGKTVLVVDDDVDFLEQQRLQLQAAGFTVITAENIKDAQALAAKSRPDAAVVDLMMQHHDDGFVLCHQLKRKFPDLPVLLVTAVTSETGMQFGSTAPEEKAWVKADVVLAKPVRFDQMLSELKRLLKL